MQPSGPKHYQFILPIGKHLWLCQLLRIPAGTKDDRANLEINSSQEASSDCIIRSSMVFYITGVAIVIEDEFY